jgi:hypothetical protein
MGPHVPVGFWQKTDSNVVMQIVEVAKTVPPLTRHYVKGHQDAEKKQKDLTLPEIYNIHADNSATQMRHETS